MHIQIASLYSYFKCLYFILGFEKVLKGFEHTDVLQQSKLAVGRKAYRGNFKLCRFKWDVMNMNYDVLNGNEWNGKDVIKPTS